MTGMFMTCPACGKGEFRVEIEFDQEVDMGIIAIYGLEICCIHCGTRITRG